MSNFTIDKQRKSNNPYAAGQSSRIMGKLRSVLLVSILTTLQISVIAQRHTDGNADHMLRGSGGVNESTLGMELNIPLGNYPGRGIDLPISINYSSKVWRTEFVESQPRINNPEACISINTLKYAERSASGWTTSLSVPYIEYTGLDNLYDERGFAFSLECQTSTPGTGGSNEIKYIKRITLHLPGGESHELRAGDQVLTYPRSAGTPVDFDGTFFAADSSNIRYLENSSNGTFKVMLPDGSVYEFSTQKEQLGGTGTPLVRKALSYTDRNGNGISYDSAAGTITDTLGRIFSIPVGLTAPSAPTSGESPQVFSLPGVGGSSVIYKFHWKRLNGGIQEESAMTDIGDPDYQLKYRADRASSSPYQPPRAQGNYLFRSEWEGWVHDEGAGLFNPVVLAKIEMPTGASYDFSYDNYGRIERIKYPTGGEEHFEYQVIPQISYSEAGDVSNQANFGVKTRKVFSDVQISTPYIWNYAATTAPPSLYKIAVISPENIKTERFLFMGGDPNPPLNYGSFGYENGLAGNAYEERVFDRNNSLVSRSVSHWSKSRLPIGSAGFGMADWHPRLLSSQRFVYDGATGAGLKAVEQFGFEFEADLDEINTPVLVNRTDSYGYENTENASYTAQVLPDPDVDPDPPNLPSSAMLIRSDTAKYLINDPGYPESTKQIYLNNNIVGLKTDLSRFDGAGNLVAKTVKDYDQSGASPSIGRGNLTGIRRWDSSRGNPSDENAYISTNRKYDQYGNMVSIIDGRGLETRSEYDAQFHTFPTKVYGPVPDPDGSNGADFELVQTSVFDANTGKVISTESSNGIQTRIEYESGTFRIKRKRQFLGNTEVGAVSETLFNDAPNSSWTKTRQQIDESNWSEVTNHYDGLGRVISSEQKNVDGNIIIEKVFDSEGRVGKISAPYRSGEAKRWTTNEYDEAGRIVRVTTPDGSSVTTHFGVLISDRRGTTKSVTDQAGRTRTGVMDAQGNITRVIEDPDGANLETDYVFDANGRVRETIQGQQHRYFYYDSIGRLNYSKQPEQDSNPSFDAVDPVTGNRDWAQRYDYDESSNAIGITDARNLSVSATYDGLNRVTKRSYSDGTPEVDFYYDGTGVSGNPARARGKLTRISSSVSEIRYLAFDEMGRIREHEQSTGNQSFITSYEYNIGGRIIAETYPSGRRMEYDLNQDGRLSAVIGQKQGQISTKNYLDRIQRTPAGGVTKLRLGNGKWESASYNMRDQVNRIGLGHSETDSGIVSLTLGYDGPGNNGSVTSQSINYSGLTDEIRQSYAYDELNRLSSVSESTRNTQTWQESFDYDRFGNRVYDPDSTSTLSRFDSVTNPEISEQSNRLLEDQDGDRESDFIYDKAGNLTRDAENKRYTYNAENRITKYFKSANSSAGPDAEYEYDGAGRRVRKRVDDVETVFVYNAFGTLIAEYSDKLPESPKISYLTQDHLGSTRVVTDGAGAVVSRSDFMAFGESLTEKLGTVSGRSTAHGYDSPGDVRKQYTGYERDEESGLDFAQARYYSSLNGRYTSVDPLTASANLRNPQTFNRYTYVLNSPYKFVDPLGLISQSTGACGQFCLNSVGNGFNGGTIFDMVWIGARPITIETVNRPVAQTDDDEESGTDGQSEVRAPQPMIAEATERFVTVVVSAEGVEDQEGILQMTPEMNELWVSNLNEAFARGVEVGAAARASQGHVVVTGMTQGADVSASTAVSPGADLPLPSVRVGKGKSASTQQENLGAAVVKKEVAARTMNTLRAIGAAAEMQDQIVNVSTATGTVSATGSYGFYSGEFRRELDLIFRRGVQMGYAGTNGPAIHDKVKITKSN